MITNKTERNVEMAVRVEYVHEWVYLGQICSQPNILPGKINKQVTRHSENA